MEEERNLPEGDAAVLEAPATDTGNAAKDGEVGLVEAINKVTGRNYKNDEEALKGIEETTKYVGKVGKYKSVIEQIEKTYGGETKATEVLKGLAETPDKTAKLVEEIEALKEESFYAKNAKYEAYKPLISALRKEGQSLEEIVNSDAFKVAFKNDSETSTKSVIHSNTRIATSSSDQTRKMQRFQNEGGVEALTELLAAGE
jgi:hypothetical protein